LNKFIFALIVVSFCARITLAQSKAIGSTAKEVTIFLQGAQVFRTAKADIPAGESTIVLNNLSPFIDPGSIQVGGFGSFSILGISHKLNYLEEERKTQEVKTLEDKKDELQKTIKRTSTQIEVGKDELDMLAANRKIGGDNTGTNLVTLKEAADYYRKRTSEIKLKNLELTFEVEKLSKDLQKIDLQLNQLRQKSTLPVSEISVSLLAKAATTATFEFSYKTGNASWAPKYDLRFDALEKPVVLDYKADVQQQTGEEWKNVKLTLSSGNPSDNATKPSLFPWRIDFYSPVVYLQNPRKSKGNVAYEMAASPAPMADMMKVARAETVMETQVVEQVLQAEFRIQQPYDVPSQQKPITVTIGKHELPVRYRHYAVPKLEKSAFLTATLSDWENLNLLAGQANLFFEGTFVGLTSLNPQELSDSLVLSLGQDKNIVVDRKRLKDQSKKQFLGSSKTDTRGWELSFRNKKSVAINLVVEDQFPTSVNNELKVELTEKAGAEVEPESGKLSWKFTLPPTSARTLKFAYEVKYPKDKQVLLE
jgi:uncharacterized protein (TIGR02231 family)